MTDRERLAEVEGRRVTARDIAEPTTILRATVGSTLHGLALEGTDDRDEMGVCVEPPEYVIGLRHFEQWVHRTKPKGVRSGVGDLDLTIYSLRKFARLALNGNPTILLLLFAPRSSLVVSTELGLQLQEMSDAFVSRRAGKAFLGYLEQQRQRLVGERGQKRTKRPELVEAHGYDTKYAMHMLRLGMQGREFMETGRLTLPMPLVERNYLMRVRRGTEPLQEILTLTGELERVLKDLLDSSPLPVEPARARVDRFLIRVYGEMWADSGLSCGEQR